MPVFPRVGNDIVDLYESFNAEAHLRPRFVHRICNPDEIERVEAAQDASFELWSLFAAKEAAYKAVVKLRPSVILAHRRFAVAADMRSVTIDDLTLSLQMFHDRDWVHAIAIAGATCAMPLHGVERVGDGAEWNAAPDLSAALDLGAAARDLLRRSVALRLGCTPAELDVVRPRSPGSWDDYGPPMLLCNGVGSGMDISLSHDNRFVAFAAISDAPPPAWLAARPVNDLRMCA